jgi:hypothetical protein
MPLNFLAHINPLPVLSADTTILQIAIMHWLGLDGYRLSIERRRVGAMPAGDGSPNDFGLGIRIQF